MSATELKDELERDSFLQSRELEISLKDNRTVYIKEFGNPDITIDDSLNPPQKIGDSKVPERVQQLADETLGTHNYSCTVYSDETTSETTIEC